MADSPATATSSDASPSPSRAREGAVVAGKGAVFIGLAKAIFVVAGFAQRALLARILPAAEYGAFSLVNGVVSTVNNTMVQGTIQAVSKFTAQSDDNAQPVKRAGLWLQAVLGSLVGGGFLLAAPFIVRLLNVPAYYLPWFRLVSVIPFLYGFYAVFVGSANGLRRFRVQAGFDITFSILKTVCLLGGAWLLSRGATSAGGVTGAFSGFAFAALIILVIAARIMGWPRPGTGRFPITTLLPFMGGVVVYAALVNLALNYDLWWLRYFAGATADPHRADTLAGNYEAIRTIALLPYQALIVVTFVIFPLVSRSVFEADRQATAAYVRQTLRIGFLFAGFMGVMLAARADVLLGLIYRSEYHEGVAAMPLLVAGQCCLALLGIACAIINAAGRPRVAVALVTVTVAVGSGLALWWLPNTAPGPALLRAQAQAAALGMAAGLVFALIYLRVRFAAGPPLATMVRVLVAASGAVAVATLVPVRDRVWALAVLCLAGGVYAALLAIGREFTADDRSQFARILRGRRAGEDGRSR